MMSVILNDANNWQTSYHAGADDEDGGHHWWILIKKHCDFNEQRFKIYFTDGFEQFKPKVKNQSHDCYSMKVDTLEILDNQNLKS